MCRSKYDVYMICMYFKLINENFKINIHCENVFHISLKENRRYNLYIILISKIRILGYLF